MHSIFIYTANISSILQYQWSFVVVFAGRRDTVQSIGATVVSRRDARKRQSPTLQLQTDVEELCVPFGFDDG